MKYAVEERFKSEERFRPGMNIFVNRAFEAFELPLHTHDAIEMSFVTIGTGYQYINDSVVPVKRGDIFLLPIGTSHVYRPPSPDKVGSLEIINCVFRLKALQPWVEFPPAGSSLHRALHTPQELDQPWFHYYDTSNRFTELFHTLLFEYRQRQHGYEVTVHALFLQIISLLHRCTMAAESPEKRSPKIQDAIQYIKDHYTEEITLHEVAEHSFLSVSHMQRLLKQETGYSFTAYVQNLRIQTCCELLQTTTMTVQQIAGAVGYQDMKFFHNLFRRRTGMTPQAYRKSGGSS